MTQQEFTQRTMVEVSVEEYSAIETVYMNSDLDKDEFCKMWRKMNKTRVQNAIVERKIQQREEAFKSSLTNWFYKWLGSKKFNENWNTPIVYTRLSVYEVKAMSHAGITAEGTLSDVHYKVGEYLGLYK